MNCPATFIVEDVEGVGTIDNLSERGCAISSTVVVPGEGYATVSITLPDQAEPLCVDLARVRWATQTGFGLEFRMLSHAARQRLMRFLTVPKAA